MELATDPAQADEGVPLPASSIATQLAVASPVSLTASDGTGLELTRYRAEVVLEGPLAFTQIELTFHNPEPRTREGRFAIRLPEQAAISRFAMHGPTGWQEAEVVERKQAQLIYEDYLHRRVDPALLENTAGNEFSARVFPIAPGEDKHLIVSFSSELDGTSDYVLPLRGLPRIADLSASVRVLSPHKPARVTRLSERGQRPKADLVVPQDAEALALRDGHLALLRLTPRIETRPADIHDLTILVDTSASRMLNLGKDVENLASLLQAVASQERRSGSVELFAFDQEVEPIYEGPVAGFGAAQQQRLLRRRALGASDLLRALSSLQGTRRERVLLITDAIATAGEVETLLAAAKGLRLDVGRIDVLLSGGLRDQATAQQLSRSIAADPGIVAEFDADVRSLLSRLRRTTHTVVPAVEGAKMVLPTRLESVQPGDTRLVYVVLEQGAASGGTLNATLSVDGKQQTHRVPWVSARGPLLRRATAAAQVRQLQADVSTSTGGAEALRQRIIELSLRHRVLSNYTAMLVLESDADYARYGLRREALADILAVGPRGVELLQRTDLHTPPPKESLAQATEPLRTKRPSAQTRPPPRQRNAPQPESVSPPRTVAEQKARGDVPQRLASSDDAKKISSDQSAAQSAAAEPAPPRPTAPQGASRAANRRAHAPRHARREAAPADVAEERSASRGSPLARGIVPGDLDPGRATRGAGVSDRGTANSTQRRPAPPAPRPSPPPAAPMVDMVAEAEAEAPAREAEDMALAGSPGWDTSGPSAHEGEYADVQRLLHEGDAKSALALSLRWLDAQPGEALALLALGEALEQLEDRGAAARAYGSLLDLFPSRADLRRFAATRLDRLSKDGHRLALDSYAKARQQRPDHLTGYRLEAYALAKQGRLDAAVELLLSAFGSDSRIQRAALSSEVLRHDVSLLAAAWAQAAPKEATRIRQLISRVGVGIATQATVSFVLSWETDANDVDLHVLDGRGGHAYYAARGLPSGGNLLEDVTRGYGPELFVVPDAGAFPYELGVHYYSRGPMGYGMGRVEIIRHDGRGGLQIEIRPFVIMNDGAKVSLGRVE